jgi:hypothetical protein
MGLNSTDLDGNRQFDLQYIPLKSRIVQALLPALAKGGKILEAPSQSDSKDTQERIEREDIFLEQ